MHIFTERVPTKLQVIRFSLEEDNINAN